MNFWKINPRAIGLFNNSDLVSRVGRQANQYLLANQGIIDQAMTASRLSERISGVGGTFGSSPYRPNPAPWMPGMLSTAASSPWFNRAGERMVAELGSGVLGRLTGPSHVQDLMLKHSFASSVDVVAEWQQLGISGLAGRQANQYLLANQGIIDQAMTASRLSERISGVGGTFGSSPYRPNPAPWMPGMLSTAASSPWFNRAGERMVAELGSGVLGRLTGPSHVQDLMLKHSFASSVDVADAISRFQRQPFFDGAARTTRVASLFQRMDQLEEELGTGDQTAARLAVLLRHVGVGRALEMMELMIVDGPKPLIEVLGEVLLEEQARAVFETAVAHSDLPAHVEDDLCHALEHLREEEYGRAFPPLLTGLEGALRHAARLRGDRKKRSNARAVAAVLGVEKEHELLIGMIYGEANDGRHGEELDRHAACVLALVGLVIWIDFSLNKPAVRWLGRKLDDRLHMPAVTTV